MEHSVEPLALRAVGNEAASDLLDSSCRSADASLGGVAEVNAADEWAHAALVVGSKVAQVLEAVAEA